MFQPAEPPNDVALPIDLHQIRLILIAMIGVAEPSAAKDLPVRQQLVGKALQTFPQLHLLSIHIDQQGAEIRRRKNSQLERAADALDFASRRKLSQARRDD